MFNPVKIDAFHQKLNEEQEESVLLAALRKLTEVEDAREVRTTKASPMGSWSGWSM